MYTVNGAFSMRQEERTGHLAVNKDADFVVIDRDILLLEEEGRIAEVGDAKVVMTVLEGQEVWVA